MQYFCNRMTKRISHILLSLTLCVMLVALTSGVTLVRCMHSGMVEMATLADLNSDNGCEGECMELTTLQLDTLASVTPLSIDFHPSMQLAAVAIHLLAYWAQPTPMVKSPVAALPLLEKGPPRVYLTLIRVLLI